MAWTEKYVSVAGGGVHDGTSEADAWTLAEAIAGEAAGQRINVKAGTYASTTTTRTMAAVGTTTAPIWWRGYNATIGDLDASHALALPALTFTTGQFVVSGAFHILSNLDISGACVTANGQASLNGPSTWAHRCRFTNTASNTNARAFTLGSSGSDSAATGCYASANATATYAAAAAGSRQWFVGCTIRGGATCLGLTSTSDQAILCVLDDPGAGAGVEVASTGCSVLLCSIYGAGTDAVRVTSASIQVLILNPLTQSSGGYSVNQSAGTTAANVRLLGHAYRLATSGPLNGITESLEFAPGGSLGSDPFTNAASHDFSIASVAKALGFPGAYENETYTGYLDPGAVQRVEPSGGGGMLLPRSMNGGYSS